MKSNNLPEWRKEEIRIREESNDRYPKVTIGWGCAEEDFEKAKFFYKEKRISENIVKAETKVETMVHRIKIKRNVKSYICYMKWLRNQYRCTLKELQCSLKYAKFYKKAYYSILGDIESGFYTDSGYYSNGVWCEIKENY